MKRVLLTLATALMLILSLPFVAFAQYEENRGLFGRGGSSADYNYSSGESLMCQGGPVELNHSGLTVQSGLARLGLIF